MDKMIVRGGDTRLQGTVKVEGAKKRGITDFSSKYFSR